LPEHRHHLVPAIPYGASGTLARRQRVFLVDTGVAVLDLMKGVQSSTGVITPTA